jgi:hypothetical protein
LLKFNSLVTWRSLFLVGNRLKFALVINKKYMKKVLQLLSKQTLLFCLFLISSVSMRQTLNFLFKKNQYGFGTVFSKNVVAIFSLGMLLMGQMSVGQVVIASDGFNNSTSLFNLSVGAYYTGNSASGDRPATSPFAVEGTHSRGVSNASATITSNLDINTTNYTGVSMSFRLASFSIGSTGNGADTNDFVTVEVSPDGGINYYSTVRVGGNTNAQWSYTGGTANASTAYDGNITPVTFAPATGGNRTTDGYSTVTITGLPAVSNLRFRITMLNNSPNERWVVDDFKVSGTLTSAAPTVTNTAVFSIATNAATFAGNVTALNGSSVSATGTVYAVKATNANPQLAGTGVTNLATPAPGAGTGTFSNASGAVLSPNVQYSYNAYATNTTGTGYGTAADFYTLANVPLAPTVSNPQITTLDVSLNTTEGNPASTEYAIHEFNTDTYVQADGTLGVLAVWNTLAGWSSSIVVNGLTESTTYNFFTKARNGANTETIFSANEGSGTTLANTLPTIETSTLAAFAATCINTSAVVQTLEVYGYFLNSTPVVVGPFDGFAFLSNDGVSYTAQVSFVPDGNGEVLQAVLVRFTPTVVQSYNGTIPVSGGGATTVNVSVVGSGINTAPTVTSPTSAAVGVSTATLGGTITAAGCSAITERGIYYSTTTGFVDGDGISVSESGSYTTGAFTINTTALTSNTVYYYKAFATSASSGTAYSTQGTFTTTCGVATVPFLQNFESVTTPALPTCSTIQNAGTGNNWVTSSVNDYGFSSKVLDYSWNSFNAANAWYYTQGISLTAGTTYQISYKYGNNSTAYIEKLKVAYGNDTVNTAMTSALADYPNITGASAVTATNYFVAPATGVFYFGFNAYSEADQFDLYVDDIAIDVAPTCIAPTALTSTAFTATTASLSWTASASNPVDGYDYYYATSATAPDGSTTPSGSVASGVTTVDLSPLSSSTTYYFWVRANCGSGDTTAWADGGSFATTALAAPLASIASDVTSTSFTANWNAVAGATSYVLDVYEVTSGGNTTDLFISEYAEGSSNNKYIEIFNGTGSTVNLSDYEIRLFSNGASSPSNTESLSGTLANGATLVFRNSSANLSGTIGYSTSSVTNFNGDDALGLFKISTSTYVDIFGVIGNDPGSEWNGAGGYTTSDKTLRRKSSISGGITVNPAETGPIAFTTLTTEWDLFDMNEVSGLGFHTFDGGTALTYFTQDQNVGNTTSYTLTGLTPETQYFYVVRATDGTVSANSNAIEVNTLLAPITWNGTAWSNTVGPDATADAFIDGNYSSTADIICKDLTVNTGIVLTITATNTLSVSGNMTNNGSIVFESTAAGTGRFDAYTGAPITGTGTVTAERYVPAKRAYRILTTPLTGTTNNSISANWQGTPGEGLLLFSPATYQSQTMVGYATGGVAPNIRKYNGGWSNITDLTTEPMYGATATDTKPFLVFVTGADGSANIASGSAATTLRPTGQLITGTVNHTSLAANTFYALANPYASAISAASLIANNAGQKLWLIDPSLGSFGAYATFDGTSWVPTTPTGDALNIQSGQGFFIRSASATSFAIAESDKIAGSSTLWFARTENTVKTELQKDKIRLLLFKQVANEFQLADGILSVNYAEGTNDVDEIDTNKISNFNESIMFRNNTTNLAIEHRALPQAGDMQQMRMTSTTANPYQLRVFTESYTSSTLQPYLEDTTTGALTAIPMDGSEVIVPFTGVVSNATTPDLRFRIVYQTNLSTAAPSLTNVKVYPNPVVNGQLNINLGADTTNAKYTITNLLGQSVQQGELATTQNTITVPTLTKGMYILNISQEERTYTTKIYVQ